MKVGTISNEVSTCLTLDCDVSGYRTWVNGSKAGAERALGIHLSFDQAVAGSMVALAAFDYFYLDGKYLHVVHAVVNSLLHFSLP
jgi:hypothetical protein